MVCCGWSPDRVTHVISERLLGILNQLMSMTQLAAADEPVAVSTVGLTVK